VEELNSDSLAVQAALREADMPIRDSVSEEQFMSLAGRLVPMRADPSPVLSAFRAGQVVEVKWGRRQVRARVVEETPEGTFRLRRLDGDTALTANAASMRLVEDIAGEAGGEHGGKTDNKDDDTTKVKKVQDQSTTDKKFTEDEKKEDEKAKVEEKKVDEEKQVNEEKAVGDGEAEKVDKHATRDDAGGGKARFKLGDHVEANYRGRGIWYGAKVTSATVLDGQPRYAVGYTSGRYEGLSEDLVVETRLRPAHAHVSSSLPPLTAVASPSVPAASDAEAAEEEGAKGRDERRSSRSHSRERRSEEGHSRRRRGDVDEAHKSSESSSDDEDGLDDGARRLQRRLRRGGPDGSWRTQEEWARLLAWGSGEALEKLVADNAHSTLVMITGCTRGDDEVGGLLR
jgi:hypothetical protein